MKTPREAIRESNGRWFITEGYPGFDSPGNKQGHFSRNAAVAAMNAYKSGFNKNRLRDNDYQRTIVEPAQRLVDLIKSSIPK